MTALLNFEFVVCVYLLLLTKHIIQENQANKHGSDKYKNIQINLSYNSPKIGVIKFYNTILK